MTKTNGVMVPFAAGAMVGLLLHGAGHQRPLSWLLLAVAVVSLLVGGADERGWWTGPRNRQLQNVLRSAGLGASFGLISLANHDVGLKLVAVLVVLGLLLWRDCPSAEHLNAL